MISSESLGIPGTDINVQANLGIEKKSTYELRLVLRPSKKNKFRFNYIPLTYDADTTITGEIIFNGIRFPVNTQVRTLLEWKTYRAGWEWDFISQPRWFIGSVLQVKWTDVNFELNSPIGTEFARAKAPIPAIGFIGRAWVTKRVAITGEWSAFKLPDTIDSRYGGHDYEWDVNGMVNITQELRRPGGLAFARHRLPRRGRQWQRHSRRVLLRRRRPLLKNAVTVAFEPDAQQAPVGARRVDLRRAKSTIRANRHDRRTPWRHRDGQFPRFAGRQIGVEAEGTCPHLDRRGDRPGAQRERRPALTRRDLHHQFGGLLAGGP